MVNKVIEDISQLDYFNVEEKKEYEYRYYNTQCLVLGNLYSTSELENEMKDTYYLKEMMQYMFFYKTK